MGCRRDQTHRRDNRFELVLPPSDFVPRQHGRLSDRSIPIAAPLGRVEDGPFDPLEVVDGLHEDMVRRMRRGVREEVEVLVLGDDDRGVGV